MALESESALPSLGVAYGGEPPPTEGLVWALAVLLTLYRDPWNWTAAEANGKRARDVYRKAFPSLTQ